MDEVVGRLGQWLWKTCPAVLDTLAPGLSEPALDAHEQDLGAKLPAGMRALYRWRNGTLPDQIGGNIVGRYALASLESAIHMQRMMNELLDRGDFKTKNWWRKTWVPIFDKGTGDSICWDPRGSFSGESGQVLEFWHTDHDRKVLAPSFDGFLTAYVESLEAGVWTYDADEGLEDGGQFERFLGARFAGYPYLAIDFNGKRPRPPAPPPPLVEADESRPVKVYAVSTKFEVGERVAHPQFGTGVVQAVEQTKATIAFASGTRTLIHARGGGDKLEKPQPIDHSKPRPKF